MTISPINSIATPPVSSTSAAPAPAPTAATTKATRADAFEQAPQKGPVSLNVPIEDEWAEEEFESVKSGGGGIAGVDPADGRVVRG